MPGIQNPTRTLAGECTAMLENLAKYSVVNGEKHRTPLALLGNYPGGNGGLFRSGFNSDIVETVKLQEKGSGKVRTIIVKYLQRALTSEIESAYTPCVNNTKPAEKEDTIDTSGFITKLGKLTINKRDFLKVCENPDEAIMRRVMTKIDALLRSLDEALMAKLIAKAGANIAHTVVTVPDPSLITDYKTLNITDTARNPKWASVDTLLEDLEENEWGAATPAILFSNKGGFSSYVRAEKIGCCNDSGQNIQAVAQQLGFAPYKSKSVAAGFLAAGLGASDAANAIMLLNPGSAHLLEYWDNEHDSYNIGETFTSLWVDPFSMEKFDFEVQWDSCTKEYIISVYAKKDIFGLPTDVFNVGDPLSLTNGIMLYNMARG